MKIVGPGSKPRPPGMELAVPPEGPLSMRRLEELVEVVGAENAPIFRQLIDLFRNDVAGRRDDLCLACVEGRLPDAAGLAHRLRSSAANLGLVHLLKACEAIETAARDGAAAAAQAGCERLPGLCREGLEALESWYALRFGRGTGN